MKSTRHRVTHTMWIGAGILMCLGAISFPLIHSQPQPVTIDAITTGTTTTFTLKIAPSITNVSKCSGSNFVVNSTFAYTSPTTSKPVVVRTLSQPHPSLPKTFSLTYTAPTATIGYGYKYVIGYTIIQKKKDKSLTVYTGPYTQPNQTVTPKITCQ